jgi:hypothetical protein
MLLFVEKKAILNLRLRPEVRDEFAIAADLRGASMSGLLHQFIVKTIREEKELSPQAFPKNERQVNGNVVPIPDSQIAHVRHLGDLTNETAKKKPIKKKKAGGSR